ncbi:hypothetical protein AGLY_014016 [Aphis glycines]|uniref:Uncharacterized protein n=1 Tax=Aphis glycines TaxID=307491 RepID=A0A6G0T4H3_APHGL|nr:hypothetical protein AGLY_014016 [Aphis glycines]
MNRLRKLVMMVGLNSANEINSSEYYTYVPYDQTKERLYMSLRGSVNQTDVYQENKRNKRGLIIFVGNAMYTLFGVCDDRCVKKTREAIKQTEEIGANILHIVKSQTTIASSLNQTEALNKEISTKEQKLHERMMQLQNITDDVLDLLLASEVHNLYTIITNEYTYETSTLEHIITAAREGDDLIVIDDFGYFL